MTPSNISLGNWLNIDSNDFEEFRTLVEYSFRNNINSFDTASSYIFGEESLGYALKKLDRSKLCLSTKYYNVDNKKYIEGVCPEYLNEYIEISLEKISTNYLDIVFIHNYNDDMNIKHIMESLNLFYKKGKIKSWGICRWPESAIKEAVSISHENNYLPPIYYQGVFNLFNLSKNQIDFIGFLKSNNINYLGYSPLARGVLTNKYNKITPAGSRAQDKEKVKYMYDLVKNKIELVSSLELLAKRCKCTVTQLVFSYLLSYNLDTVITGVRNKDQLSEIVDSKNISLDLNTKNIIKKKFNIYG